MKTITINGTRLDEVRLLMPPQSPGAVSYLSYPSSEFCCAWDGDTLSLAIPAVLAVELYRSGILSQDANVPVSVKFGSGEVQPCRITDVRYGGLRVGPADYVTFTLQRVKTPPAATTAPQGTFVSDIRHFLDEDGQVAQMPGPARQMASFLTLLVDESSGAFPAIDHDTQVRCRTAGCRGTIRVDLASDQDEIAWYCPRCGHNGVIRNWQGTRWDRIKSAGRPE